MSGWNPRARLTHHGASRGLIGAPEPGDLAFLAGEVRGGDASPARSAVADSIREVSDRIDSQPANPPKQAAQMSIYLVWTRSLQSAAPMGVG